MRPQISQVAFYTTPGPSLGILAYYILRLYLIQMITPQYGNNNDLRKKIQDYSYGLKDVIGRGFSSVVYRGTNDKTKQKVAVKVIDIRAIQGKPQKRMLEGEIQALKKLAHPHIMKCHDIFSTANNCYIITEFCNEGDLENLLKKREKLSEDDAIPIIREILMGFIHIAENGFLHRDLKPANILLKDKTVKIADFGFAKRITSNTKETVNVGSPLYMSPQALNGNIYTVKNDIWSIGVILYEILHGKAPWTCSSQKQLIEQINKNNISMLRNLSQDLKQFIRKCLTPDDRKRFSLKQFASHSFLTRIMADGPPLLLRKITSNNENQQQINNSQNQPTNKPKILHHRQHQGEIITPQKQFLCQLNWMRFLNKYYALFGESQSKNTIGLKFIIIKQLLSQLQSLQLSLTGENIFFIEGWKDYLKKKEDKQIFIKSIEDYKRNYQPYAKQLNEWIPQVTKDKKLSMIADNNLQRSEYLSMLGLSYAINQCKALWQLFERTPRCEGQLQGKIQQQAQRLDFTMTYFQLNQFLVDNFNDSEFFTRVSHLQVINQCKPAHLEGSNLTDLQHKLKVLQLLK